MTDDEMTIRQMCDAFDVTPRTLRFYEAKELLFPRREGQKRLFTRRDRARLKLILRGKRFGFSARGNPPASRPLLRGRPAGDAA
jgi:DNA-binding transcriptional MerR regulator